MNALRAEVEPGPVEGDQTRCLHCGAAAGRHMCKVLKRETGHTPEEQPSCTQCGDAPGGCVSCDGRQYQAEALSSPAPHNPRLARSRKIPQRKASPAKQRARRVTRRRKPAPRPR